MKKIGLTLSGGGLRGVAHFGVLKAMHEFGIVPEVITGTSFGSIVAGIYASGYTYEESVEILYSIDSSIMDPDYFGVLKSIFKLSIPNGFIKGNKFEKYYDELVSHVNVGNIDDIQIAIIASNLNGGENIIFSNGQVKNYPNSIVVNDFDLSKAVRASISLPLVFKPVFHEDFVLVDGGIVNNCPINVAQELGAEVIISSDIAYDGKKLENAEKGQSILSRVIQILLKESYLNDHMQVDVPVINIKLDDLDDIPTLDFSKENYDKALKIGYERAKEELTKHFDILKGN